MTPLGSGLRTSWCAGFSRPVTVARTASTTERSQSARDRSISRLPRRSGNVPGSEPPGGASMSAPRSRSRCGSACAPRAGRRGKGSPRSGPVASSLPGIWRPDRGPRPRPVHSFCRLGVHGVVFLVAGKAHGMEREMPDAGLGLGLSGGRPPRCPAGSP